MEDSLFIKKSFSKDTFGDKNFFCGYQGYYRRYLGMEGYLVTLHLQKLNSEYWKKHLFKNCVAIVKRLMDGRMFFSTYPH